MLTVYPVRDSLTRRFQVAPQGLLDPATASRTTTTSSATTVDDAYHPAAPSPASRVRRGSSAPRPAGACEHKRSPCQRASGTNLAEDCEQNDRCDGGCTIGRLALGDRLGSPEYSASAVERASATCRPDGSPLADRHTLSRIRALAIPPAWIRVWICERADGHIQATGYDASEAEAVSLPRRLAARAGREQVRAPEELRPARCRRSARGFDARSGAAWARPGEGAGSHRPLAGNDLHPGRQRGVHALEWNASASRPCGIGTSTIVGRPVSASASAARAASVHEVDVADRRLARIIRSCQELPGQELFQYRGRRWERARRRVLRCERVPAGGHRRGLHRQGLPDLGRNGARSESSGRAAGAGDPGGGAAAQL